jgi:hypothetical protein
MKEGMNQLEKMIIDLQDQRKDDKAQIDHPQDRANILTLHSEGYWAI